MPVRAVLAHPIQLRHSGSWGRMFWLLLSHKDFMSQNTCGAYLIVFGIQPINCYTCDLAL